MLTYLLSEIDEIDAATTILRNTESEREIQDDVNQLKIDD